ncbi:DUF1995 family protein [Aphanothece sacrum]|uniref:DUF1995 domain-containing protein n=1 Tax=Aphanothece sacrum FPU1 TaxID=1920663 RepID=A0A401IBU3_APHSA|nr:DUF1995 family protein [Aphanothece sacrum]GBF78719.1 hypothetical protein AsFPU1_0108 [Aphanothece sacrum FPU1]GBF86950.1 hypothetical protein AsFPU3_4027 [Aphanothece sacrum FPU3]
MLEVPNTLEEAVNQAKQAAKLALKAGVSPLQIELVIPEIALQAQSLALEFVSLFEGDESGLKVLFPDTGAAALARRDWGETAFKVSDLGSRFTSIEMKISDDDQAFLVVCPSSVEVGIVEKLCNLAGDRPVVLLIPQLEDVSIVGIGYAARQLRERFLNTLQSVYYFRPLEGVVVLRSYPSQWQVYLETENGYQFIAEASEKPAGEPLELLIANTLKGDEEKSNNATAKKSGLFTSMQRFLRALSQ